MIDSKKEMLNRISKALVDRPPMSKPEDIDIPRNYKQKGSLSRPELLNLFVERVSDYKANVRVIDISEIVASIEEICTRKNLNTIVTSDTFPTDLRPTNVEVVVDHPTNMLSNYQLDSVDAVVTTCAIAVAQTGTIALDAGIGQGRRVLSLIPDVHICIVKQDQVVEIIPEAFKHLKDSVEKKGRPITLISGPSATSDIELNRVEGVHGPRILEVLVVR